MTVPFDDTFKDLTVLVTGHTGFKGSWLSIWLNQLGSNVIGYSLEPPTQPNNFETTSLAQYVTDIRGDIRDLSTLRQTIQTYEPTVVFHLAAQSNVLHSLKWPKETFDINVGGTVNVMEAVRTTDSVKAVVSITSDKCYANQEWIWGYRENDRLGGYEPYSSSKAMAELAIDSYRNSFFGEKPLVASTRAGNVIGGGDFADFRLVPDCMRALLAGEPIEVRNPHSVRPWQHVLEPLSGYMWLAVNLLQGEAHFASPWNFGPLERQAITTKAIAEKLISLWGDGSWVHPEMVPAKKVETNLLRLSWDKAANYLDWQPTYEWYQALAEIVSWFKAYQAKEDMYAVCVEHIQQYTQQAQTLNVGWAVVGESN